jgi:hypothetical protein
MIIGALPAITLLFTYLVLPKSYFKNILFLVTLTIYLSLTYTFTNKLFKQQILVNENERLLINQYINFIKSEDPQVKKISFVLDTQASWCFPDTVCYKDYNLNALTIDWARFALIQYVTQQKYIDVKMNQNIYNSYFKNKNWNEFSTDQIKIIDDTAYIAIY